MTAPLRGGGGGEDAGQLVFGGESDDALDLLTVLEDQHGRDAHDVEALGQVGIFVNIELGDIDFAVELLTQLFHGRLHSNAGTAPGRPKINQYWAVGLDNF